MKRTRLTPKGACGRRGYPDTTRSSSPNWIPSFLGISSSPNIPTWFLPTNNPWSVSRLHKLWYAMVRIQTLTRQGQNSMSHPKTITQPSRVGMSSPGSTRKSGVSKKKCPRYRQGFVVRHNCISGADSLTMSKSFGCWWDNLLVS